MINRRKVLKLGAAGMLSPSFYPSSNGIMLKLPVHERLGGVTSFREPWHIPKGLFAKIWQASTGRGVKIAILDTGVSRHDALPDPVDSMNFTANLSIKDRNGHGTHCAGIAVGRDGVGVAPSAELMIGKVIADNGFGSTSGIRKGIDWAVRNGADVISMSLSSDNPDAAVGRSIRQAMSKGVFVCSAAGNDGSGRRSSVGYPGAHLESCCIGSTKGPYTKQTISDYSSRGPEVDVSCPGERILSCSNTSATKYTYMSGTSMATPYMAGACAIAIECRRRMGSGEFSSQAEFDDFLQRSTKDAGKEGKDDSYGHGILSLESMCQIFNTAIPLKK